MPLIKKDKSLIYEISNFRLDADNKQLVLDLKEITYENNIPKIKNHSLFFANNENAMIIDPDFKPTENFDIRDPNTWGGYNPMSFPRILDPNRMQFDMLKNITIQNIFGTSAYGVLKECLYKMILSHPQLNLPDEEYDLL
jgi:hypothetical protein